MDGVVAGGGDLAQVVAGREGTVATRLDDDAADAGVAGQPVEFRLQCVYKVAGEGVHGVRPVEREEGDATLVAAQQDGFVGGDGHGGSLREEGGGVMPVMSPAELIDFLGEHFPQASHLGLAIEHLDDRTIRLRLPTHERHLRPGGTISGPTLMWLVDCGFYLLILGQLGPVALAVTTNLNINFMRKPEPADLIGEGRLLKLGKTLAVGDFTIWSDGKAEPVAHATVTYAIPPKA